MEHLLVKFSQGLPCSIHLKRKVVGQMFIIPKDRRWECLCFMKEQSQHVLKKRKSSWDVLGMPPPMKQRGGNKYSTYLSEVKKAIGLIPGSELAKFSITQLQRHPLIKGMYVRHFKNNPELINHQSIMNERHRL